MEQKRYAGINRAARAVNGMPLYCRFSDNRKKITSLLLETDGIYGIIDAECLPVQVFGRSLVTLPCSFAGLCALHLRAVVSLTVLQICFSRWVLSELLFRKVQS